MAPKASYSAEFLEFAAKAPMSLRAKRALNFLLENGTVTTGDLLAAGYDHPPRAIRDLKDAGFEVSSKLVTVDGRRMSEYTLVDSVTEGGGQRRPVSHRFRNHVFEVHGHRCAVCGVVFITRQLQLDHRVPFHVGGDPVIPTVDDFMPLCGSDNRAKSMSCETCPNWAVRDSATCTTCYWHDPENYTHVATEQERRLTIIVRGNDVAAIDKVAERARTAGKSMNDVVVDMFWSQGTS